jgi:hypothetical protein
MLATVLSDVTDDRSCSAHELIGSGPGNLPGCILCAWNGSPPARGLRYLPEHQNWQPVLDGSLLWIGTDLIDPVKPEDIQRTSLVEGQKVRLADGNEWTVPMYRDPYGATNLPQDMFYDQSGEFRVQVQPDYIERWETSSKLWNILIGVAEDDMPLSWALDYCTDALSINYRFDRHLQSRILVINKANYEAVSKATLRWDLMLELVEAQKKTEDHEAQPGPSSLPGPEDFGPVIDPLAVS